MRGDDASPFAKTFDDAVSILAKNGWLTVCERATVCVQPVELPDGAVVAVVAVVGPRGPTHSVTLPNAATFMARTTMGQAATYDIGSLDLASVDRGGTVQLQDGSHVHDVELVPARSRKLTGGGTQLQSFSGDDEEVLVQVLDALGLRRACYRDLDPEHPELGSVLDFALVASLGRNRQLPSLKAIENKLLAHRKELQRCGKLQGEPELRRQSVVDILARAGLRRLRSGRRARPRIAAVA